MKRIVGVVVTGVLVLAGSGLAGTALAEPAAAADRPGSVDILPGAEPPGGWGMDGQSMVATDDTLYALSPDPTSRDTVLFSRTLERSDTAVELGRTTRVARASGFALAAYDGTLAYTRGVDGRLVLRAPDGTETMPSWGTAPSFPQFGVGGLSQDWVVTSDGKLFARDGSTSVDLLDAVADIPAGAEVVVWDAELIDGYATFAAMMWDDLTVDSGIYVVPLGEDGPEGDAVRLATGDSAQPVGFVGSRVVWETFEPLGTEGTEYTTLVSSVPAASPTDTPATRALVDEQGWAWVYQGPGLVAASLSSTTVWFDPADPGTDVRTAPFESGEESLFWFDAGGLVAYGWYDEALDQPVGRLIDLEGRPIVADGGLAAPPPTFPDVSAANAFRDDISWLAESGITRGYDDGGFHPLDPVSRAAMAAFLYRLAGEPDFDPPAATPFVDVATGHPFYAEIAWLADTGISTGTVTASGTYFKPNDPVSRQAMAAFLHRFAGDPAHTAPTTSPFLDVATGHPFYAEIAWLADAGISTGTVTPLGSLYKPLDPVSRQAMAAFMHRLHRSGNTVNWHIA